MKKYYLIILLVSALSGKSDAQYKKLHDFILNNSDGWGPSCTMVLNGDKLIGMTQSGGRDSIGAIFSIDTNGSGEKILHSFNDTDGAQPSYCSLTIVGSKFYGMTSLGGTSNDGVIFSMDTNGNGYKVLLNFNGTNGSNAEGKLTLSGNKLYGTTSNGGTTNHGVIFSIDTNGSGYMVLLDFNGTNGSGPSGTEFLILGGKFYSTAGGAGNTMKE